jgi:hypothetical protein
MEIFNTDLMHNKDTAVERSEVLPYSPKAMTHEIVRTQMSETW